MNRKRMVDIDDLMQYIATRTYKNNDSGLLVGDLQRIKSLFDDYLETNYKPDVDVGDIVYTVSSTYYGYEIHECRVTRKTIKARESFSVNGEYPYSATFTKNSIGKTVFFTLDDAINSVKNRKYKVIFIGEAVDHVQSRKRNRVY